MRRNSVTHRRFWVNFCTVLLIGSLLLCECTVQPDDQAQMQPTKTTTPAAAPDAVQDTQADNAESITDESADLSLSIFRQAMVETSQHFAAAFFGTVPQDADPFTVMQESAPQLCEDLPFILSIDPNHVAGTEGQLFCIVPADDNATVAVNRRPWNTETESYEEREVLYRNESGCPILIMCPNDDWIPDTEVILTDSRGTVTVWSPHLDPDYRIAALHNENGEDLIFDFTPYDELPGQDENQIVDSSELVGTWKLTWTEIEGDRNEAAPSVCTIEITADETGCFRFTYSNRDFPEENIKDRELIVAPGELYPGCSNDQWIGDVAEDSEDSVHYSLTLLESDVLLLQTYWEMDGMPMVSYGYYNKRK